MRGDKILKALVYTKPYCLEYGDFPDPKTGDDDILIRIKACGICGSDVHGCTGKTGRRIPPLIMGHEAAGIIEKVGKNVRGFEQGQRVCFDSTIYCNRCEPCRKGLYNYCKNRQVLGVSTPEFKRHGAFAEYVAVPWWIVSKIPDHLSFVHASFLEPISIAFHATNRAPISSEDTVLTIGAGTIGLFILQFVKLKSAKKVIVADINVFRLDTAKNLGADEIINPSVSDIVEASLKKTDNKGVDVAFEAVGFAKTFRDAVSATKTGGLLIAVGNLQKTAEFDLQELVARELTFKGSYASSGEYRQGVKLLASGKINVEPLISDVMPLKDGAIAFDRLLIAEENLLKIVLEP
jgi:L-iditol 2-dehydrogenase